MLYWLCMDWFLLGILRNIISWTWRIFLRLMSELVYGFTHVIDTGNLIKVFYDNWFYDFPFSLKPTCYNTSLFFNRIIVSNLILLELYFDNILVEQISKIEISQSPYNDKIVSKSNIKEQPSNIFQIRKISLLWIGKFGNCYGAFLLFLEFFYFVKNYYIIVYKLLLDFLPLALSMIIVVILWSIYWWPKLYIF